MKYKTGDRVRIVSERTKNMNPDGDMDKYLGKVVTISGIKTTIITVGYYTMKEDNGYWPWYENSIAGLASETPFDFGAWKGKDVCMHCKTEEEAEDFRREIDKAGLRWSSGEPYLELSNFRNHENHICYFFNNGAYSGYEYAKTKGYTILEWSDYRSTEPPKEEQEKEMKPQINDTPLSYQETMDIYKRLCEHHRKRSSCRECPVSSFKNYTEKMCREFLIENTDKAEPILKKWMAEHPVKTNRDKFVEFFGKIQKYDDECEYHCATVPCQSCDWWHQEYVEPEK